MKAKHPVTNVTYYFIDKCLPFGSSISCAHFQLFSDALAHILQVQLGITVTNYLDDFLFISTSQDTCNSMVRKFIHLCNQIGVPVSKEKTELATNLIVFLGILLDGVNHCLSVLQDKKHKALNMLKLVMSMRKIKMKEIQKLTNLLNFLQKAVVPGRTFPRCMYDQLKIRNNKGQLLKHYHHVKVDEGFRKDCAVWKCFLLSGDINLCRPFVDFSPSPLAEVLTFYSDVSSNLNLGFGVIFDSMWMYGHWKNGVIETLQLSIEFLELYALCLGILAWNKEPQLVNCNLL